MAKPRVFVSSTYYDLKHIRASLDLFIESLGYEPVLSEKGDIAYTHDRPLDESCYREAENADLFVLIIGGRYGSEASAESKKPTKSFFDRYESITKKEYESAVTRDIPIYILIESGAYTEYQTFLRNKDNVDIRYAHVDSVNVFHLIEEILSRPRNNPVRSFERFSEIEDWLRDQWAGVFRELLNKQSQQQQLVALTTEIGQLKEINETLKKYLEAVMTGVTTDVSEKLIESEEKRLEELKKLDLIRTNHWYQYITRRSDMSLESFIENIKQAKTFEDFVKKVIPDRESEGYWEILRLLEKSGAPSRDFNEIRRILNLPQITNKTDSIKLGAITRASKIVRKK